MRRPHSEKRRRGLAALGGGLCVGAAFALAAAAGLADGPAPLQVARNLAPYLPRVPPPPPPDNSTGRELTVPLTPPNLGGTLPTLPAPPPVVAPAVPAEPARPAEPAPRPR